MDRDWDEHYATGSTPWDTGEPDEHLVQWVEAGEVESGRVFEVGCGTGTNALWLAQQGFDVTAVDLSALAIEQAVAKLAQPQHAELGARVRFQVLDFLSQDPPAGPFDLVFDRGVLHVFDEAADRARFAERVAGLLRPAGAWLSLAGSTEGPEREHGPPRRSARDLVEALEPWLEIVTLRSTRFDADLPSEARAWLVHARRREVPAQPSTRHDVG